MPSHEPESWRFIIHDDVYLNRDSVRKMLHVLRYAPIAPVSFYNPTNTGYLNCYRQGKHCLKTNSDFWMQAFLTPVDLIDDVISFGDNAFPNEYKWEDRRFAAFFKSRALSVYSIVPGLCQHMGAFRSTLGIAGKIGGKYIRNSSTFKPEFDVSAVDWIKEFNSPFIHNITVADPVLIAAQEYAEKFYDL